MLVEDAIIAYRDKLAEKIERDRAAWADAEAQTQVLLREAQ